MRNSAKLDAPGRGGGGGPGRSTVNTDIEQGFRGGGGGYDYASGANTGGGADATVLAADVDPRVTMAG